RLPSAGSAPYQPAPTRLPARSPALARARSAGARHADVSAPAPCAAVRHTPAARCAQCQEDLHPRPAPPASQLPRHDWPAPVAPPAPPAASPLPVVASARLQEPRAAPAGETPSWPDIVPRALRERNQLAEVGDAGQTRSGIDGRSAAE